MTSEEKAEALLPCPNPWCGNVAATFPVNGAAGWRMACDCGVRTGAHPTKAEAVTAWNTRPSPNPEDKATVEREEVARLIADAWTDGCEQFEEAVEAQQFRYLKVADAILAFLRGGRKQSNRAFYRVGEFVEGRPVLCEHGHVDPNNLCPYCEGDQPYPGRPPNPQEVG